MPPSFRAQLASPPERLALRAEAARQARGLVSLTFEQVKAACLGTGNKKGGLDGWSYRARTHATSSWPNFFGQLNWNCLCRSR